MSRKQTEGLGTQVFAGLGAQVFADSAQRVVDYLNQHSPIGDWSVSRVTNGAQVHLHVHRQDLLEPGTTVDWDESFCQRMLAGGDHVVPDATADPNYSDLEMAKVVRAYTGFPIVEEDGTLFGVLCGVAAEPLADASQMDADLVDLLSHLLSDHLHIARLADRHERDAQLAKALAATDALTGLINRRGWDRLIADAQRSLSTFGDPVSIAVVDLDDLKEVNDAKGHEAGDSILRQSAAALRHAARPDDRIARFGGDEFTILSTVGPADAPQHFATYLDALKERGIPASLGFAHAAPGASLDEVFRQADLAMYNAKRKSA